MLRMVVVVAIGSLWAASHLPRATAVESAPTFRAGAAAVDITPRNAPPEPPSIGAGGFLEGRADRVHDPLLVRAMVLDDGGSEVAWRHMGPARDAGQAHAPDCVR